MVKNTAAIALGLSLTTLAIAGPSQAATQLDLPPMRLAQASPLQQAELQRQRAALLDSQGNLTAAAALLEPALATYVASGDPNQIQQTAAFLGIIYADLGNAAVDNNQLAAALGYYRQQIAALSVGFNRFAEAQALINAGRVAQLLGPSALGQDYLLRGLAIAQEVENPALIQQAQALLNP